MLQRLMVTGRRHSQLLLVATLILGLVLLLLAAMVGLSISTKQHEARHRALRQFHEGFSGRLLSLNRLQQLAIQALSNEQADQRVKAAQELKATLSGWSATKTPQGTKHDLTVVKQWDQEAMRAFEARLDAIDNGFNKVAAIYAKIAWMDHGRPLSPEQYQRDLQSLVMAQQGVLQSFSELEGDVRELVREQLENHTQQEWRYELLAVALLVLGSGLLTVPIVFALRKLAHRLDESQIQIRQLAAVAENPMNLVGLSGPDDKLQWVNQGFTRLTGLQIDDVRDKSAAQVLLNVDNSEPSAQEFRQCVKEGREFVGEIKTKGKNGADLWLFIHRFVLLDDHGDTIGFTTMGTDITERVESQMELKASQKRLELAMEASTDGLWEWNPQTSSLYLSPSWFKLLGYSPGDFEPGVNAWQLLCHPDDRTLAFKAMDDHLAGRSERYYLEHRLKNKSGQWQWVLGRAMLTATDGSNRPLKVTGTLIDIHERKLAEERFRVLFETSPESNILIDNSVIVDANRAALELFAVTEKSAIIGTVLWEHAAELQPGKLKSADMGRDIWIQVEAGNPARFEWVVRNKAQSLIPVLVAINPLLIEGRQMGLAVILDMSLSKAAEASMKRSEQRFQLAARGTRQGIWEWDIQSDEVFFSERMCELIGIEQTERIVGIDGILTFAFPDDIGRFKRALDEHLNSRTPFDIEYRVRSKTGHYRWFRATGQATWDDDGKPLLMAGALTDITQSKMANLALARSEAMLTESQSIAQLGSWHYDVRTGEMVWSKETFRLFAMDPANEHPPTYADHQRQVHPEDLAHWKKHFESAMADGTALDFEFRTIHPNGQVRYLWVRGGAKRDDAGRVVELSGTIQDITRVRQTEGELRIQTEKLLATTHDLEAKQQELIDQKREVEAERTRAETASKTKSEFLANMSHEIRTPMTAILGFTEMLSDPAVTAEVRTECVQTIRRNGLHLLEIINDILDLSKIEAGKMDLESIPCKTRSLVDEVVTLMRVRSTTKSIDLRVEYATSVPETFKTDPTRLRQILINLISNAIKFTERGEVSMEIRYLPAARPLAPGMIEFAIRDTGIGMDHEQVQRLFQVFSQADSSTTRRFGGTGLGLAISARLAKLMGGEIVAKSEPGVGSTFTLMIVAQEPEGLLPHDGDSTSQTVIEDAPGNDAIRIYSEGREALAGVHILLAEDGQDNRRFITFILEEAGAKVDSVENGQEAVRRVNLALKSTSPIDLILMDIQMPIMDGYTAARTLRNNGWNKPIIALTAHAMVGERERCLAAGCNEYQTKPVDRIRLIRTIKDFVSSVRPSQVSAVTQAPVAEDAPAIESRPVGRPATGTGPLYSTLSGNPRVAGLIVDYIRGLSDYANKFEAALKSNDLESARTMAHHLKGSGTMYGFPTITETAGRAERLIKQKTDTLAARLVLVELIGVCRRASVREKV